MRRNWLPKLAVVLAFLLIPAIGIAQAEKSPCGSKFEKIRAAFTERLTKDLSIDQATAEKVVQSKDNFRKQARTFRQENKAVKEKLEEAVKSGAPDPEIEAILAEINTAHEKHRQLMENHQAELREILGTQGYAKYMVSMQNFRKENRHKMRWRKGHHRGGVYKPHDPVNS